MNKTLPLAAAAALVLNACATLDNEKLAAGTALDDFCATSQVIHCIDVKVSGGSIVSIADLNVSGPNHFVLWKISPLTLAYTFDANGIAFKPGNVLPSDEFRCRIAGGGRLFFCVNRNTTARTYTYKVTLNPVGGGTPLVLDPRIVNN